MRIQGKLPLLLSAGLLALTIAHPAYAQDADQDSDKDQATTEQATSEASPDDEEIVITGSLIPRPTSATGISPVTVVTAEDAQQRGLLSVAEVLGSMTQNKGYSEGKASNLLGLFTPGAEAANFHGLGSGRTLVLINGRRIADYPLPFGGEQNGVDLGAIPDAAMARVEYLSAGASAIYGSDAIGGVVNIITKRDMQQTTASIRAGEYLAGFGPALNASIVTGKSFERGSFTLGVQANLAGKITVNDSKWLRDNHPARSGVVSLIANGAPFYVSDAQCSALGYEGESGTCIEDIGDNIGLNPEIRQYSGFFDGRYDLTDSTELFVTGLLSINDRKSVSSPQLWQGAVINFDDPNQFVSIQRGFGPDELPRNDIIDKQTMWTVTAGAKTNLEVGDRVWTFDFSYSHAEYRTFESMTLMKEEGVRDWFLDGASMVVDYPGQKSLYLVDGDFFSSALLGNILRPVQAGDVAGIVGENITRAHTSADTVLGTLNGTLSDLGVFYQPVKFALRAEYGNQSLSITPDERSLNETGQGWYGVGALLSSGSRSRKALALELSIPALSILDISLASRVDAYSDDSNISSRISSQAKFLLTATDWLKIRGGYSQTFRAPDMVNIYGRSDGSVTITDFAGEGCYDGQNLALVCSNLTVPYSRRPDRSLAEESGDDFSLGFVVQPTEGFFFTADWYSLKLNNVVVSDNPQQMLLREWQCDTGVFEGGSQLCQDVYSRIIRNIGGGISQIIGKPINQASLQQQGLDVRMRYQYTSEKWGTFSLDVSHSKVLHYVINQFDGDEPIDIRYGWPQQSTPENSTTVNLGWFNPLTTGKGIGLNVFVQRQDGIYNFTGTQFMKPMYNVSASASYQLNARTSVSLNVNNVLNTAPQENGSPQWPGFWPYLQMQNALGRSAFLTVSRSFR